MCEFLRPPPSFWRMRLRKHTTADGGVGGRVGCFHRGERRGPLGDGRRGTSKGASGGSGSGGRSKQTEGTPTAGGAAGSSRGGPATPFLSANARRTCTRGWAGLFLGRPFGP